MSTPGSARALCARECTPRPADEDYPGEKIRADRPLKHINIDSLSSSVVSIEGYFPAVVMVDCHTYMHLHALNYMTSTYPLHDITWNSTISESIHEDYTIIT